MTKQITFNWGAEKFYADGHTYQSVSLGLLGAKLPQGMVGYFSIEREDGDEDTTEVTGWKQARSQHGRRRFHYCGTGAVDRAVQELTIWAQRIVRERAKEIAEEQASHLVLGQCAECFGINQHEANCIK